MLQKQKVRTRPRQDEGGDNVGFGSFRAHLVKLSDVLSGYLKRGRLGFKGQDELASVVR